MAGMRWLKWGMFFSVVLFVAIYLLIYKRVADDPTVILMLGKMDVSGIGVFFSKIKNVIIASLIGGFLLGLLTGSGRRRQQY
jgi:hypothetical protein